MNTINKDFVGPTLTKKQRAEAQAFWTKLSEPAQPNDLEICTKTIESSTLNNEDIDKLMAQLKSMKTSTHRSGPTTGVGARCKELIKTGLSNKDVLAKIKEEFPMNNTTYSCVAWYRNDLKQKNEL